MVDCDDCGHGFGGCGRVDSCGGCNTVTVDCCSGCGDWGPVTIDCSCVCGVGCRLLWWQ